MTKFKKGDVVRVKDAHDSVGISVGELCVVSEIASPTALGQWIMLVGKKNDTSDGSYLSDSFELVTFTPGDRVVLTVDNDLWGKKGDAGTVLAMEAGDARVRFDKTVHGQREWLVDVRRLADLAAAAQEKWVPKVGDLVECIQDTAIVRKGQVYTVVNGLFPLDPGNKFYVDTGADYGALSYNSDYFKPAPFTIEAGRYYKTRDGRKVGPMKPIDHSGRSLLVDHAGRVASFVAENLDKERIGGSYTSGGEWLTGQAGFRIVSLWPEEPTNIGAQIDTLSDEYGPWSEWSEPKDYGAVTAGAAATKPKFRVGDRVASNNVKSAGYGIVEKVLGGGLYEVDFKDSWYRVCRENETSISLATPTAIVCLIEDGQPKPATRPYVHGTKESATTEARRLAGVHKGQEFGVYVLADTAKEEAVREEKVYDHEWQRLAARGEKINAIKELRRITGLGLKPTKDAVEYWLDVA